jgi:hypothetical protein|tara:strand:+ start:368 stop:541 length:174 start_codon:yes stop_codon:yes gene_type:complete
VDVVVGGWDVVEPAVVDGGSEVVFSDFEKRVVVFGLITARSLDEAAMASTKTTNTET